MVERRRCKVCVTGGAGYIGSSLVYKLLEQNYFVHVTLRNLNDQSKVDRLKSFPEAEERLKFFVADIYKAEEFEAAIQGCEFVFHVATPMVHTEGYKFSNRVDATVDASRSIASSCKKSGTVRRLIYTASVMAASPLKEDGSGYKEVMDESCWTPLNLSIPYGNDFVEEYTKAKTLTEKEILNFNHGSCGGMEVVTLACGLVGGYNLMQSTSVSASVIISPVTGNDFIYNSLKFLEELNAKIPIVHLEDVCNAHIFCMQEASMGGRYLCANGYVSIAEMSNYYREKYPHYTVKNNDREDHGRNTKWGSTLLTERGFKYKYEWQMVLDDCISSARKNGDI